MGCGGSQVWMKLVEVPGLDRLLQLSRSYQTYLIWKKYYLVCVIQNK
jgi:hypothetical protein